MAVFTLLKTGLRRKKGSFIGVIILMLIISMSIVSVLSINENSRKSVEESISKTNAPDFSVIFMQDQLTDEMIEKIKNDPYVGEVREYDLLNVRKLSVNGMETEDGVVLIMPYQSRLPLFKDDSSDYDDVKCAPAKNEAYVSQQFLSERHTSVGGEIETDIYYTNDVVPDKLNIVGTVADPKFGGMNSSASFIYVSEETFQEMKIKQEADFKVFFQNAFEKQKELTGKEDPEPVTRVIIKYLEINKAEGCTMSDSEFKVHLNLETHIADRSQTAMTNEEAVVNDLLFPNIISALLIIFLVCLMAVSLLVIRHNIISGIELDYTDLGIYKAMGFTSGQIRLVITLRYLIAQIIGIILGTALSIPVVLLFGRVFNPLVGVPVKGGLEIVSSMLIILLLLAVSVLFIFFSTRKVMKVSPIKAIRGGSDDIYFSSRFRVRVRPRILSFSLGMRQLWTNKKNYIGTTIISAVLVFFMLTVSLLGDMINSKSSLESMGHMVYELVAILKNDEDYNRAGEIEQIIEKYTSIENKYYCHTEYVSVGGVKTLCIMHDSDDGFNIISGREPRYENEIAITEFVAEEQGLSIGQEIELTYENQKAKYLIVGINQCLYDTGHNVAMNMLGAKRLGEFTIRNLMYSLSDPSQAYAIKEYIDRNCQDLISYTDVNDDPVAQITTLNTIFTFLKYFIIGFSVIFSLIVISMVCRKAFLKEKTDIGIYKAVGFRVNSLRLQFAFRFMAVSVIGAAIGAILSLLFTNPLLSVLIRNAGITSFKLSFTASSIILPVAIITGCFFLFAFIVSRSVKKVDVRSLIFE